MVNLVWEGKYDAEGAVCRPVRAALPLETIETLGQPASVDDWHNRIIHGDKKAVLPSLLPEFAGKVDLIYIDPPFATGKTFYGKNEHGEQVEAYRDTWPACSGRATAGGKGLDSYLKWFYETAVLLRDLLSEKGSLYVHLDYHVGHYAKCILDEVFGLEQFKNEIIWHYSRWPAKSPMFQRSHDTIFWYGKGSNHIWNQQFQPLSAATIKRFGGKQVRGETTKIVLEADSLGAQMHDVWELPHVLGANPERVDYATQKPERLIERIIAASSNKGDLVLDCFCGSGTTAATAEKLGRRWITCDLGRFAIHTARKRLLAIPNVKPFIVQNCGQDIPEMTTS